MTSCMCFITHIEAVGKVLKIWVQHDTKKAEAIERDIQVLKGYLHHSASSPRSLPVHGEICFAKYTDEEFYRCNVLNSDPGIAGHVNVLFIDYGNTSAVKLSDIKQLKREEEAKYPALGQPPQAAYYYLYGIALTSPLTEYNLEWLKSLILNSELNCVIHDGIFGIKMISILVSPVGYLSRLIIEKKIGIVISSDELCKLVSEYTSANFPIVPQSATQLPDLTKRPPSLGTLTPQYRLQAPKPLESLRSKPTMTIYQPPALQQQAQTQPRFNIPKEPAGRVYSEVAPRAPLVNNVSIGNTYECYVSHVESGPFQFSIQVKTYADEILRMLSYSLNMVPLHNFSTALSPGTVVIGRNPTDRTLWRGMIISTDSNSCKVLYIDVGSTQELPHSHIYQLPTNLKTAAIPGVALTFALSGIDDNKVTPSMKQCFKDLVLTKTVHIKVVSEGPARFCNMYLNGQNVLELLVNMNQQPLQYLRQLPPMQDIPVIVSFVDSPSQFFVQYKRDGDTLSSVEEAVNRLWPTLPEVASMSDLFIGKPVLSLFPLDKRWYRAQVMDLNPLEITVWYIDYGNKEQVQLNGLRQLSSELVSNWRAQAVECCLVGYESQPVDPNLADLLEVKILNQSLTLQLNKLLSGDRLLVDLIDSEGKSIVAYLNSNAPKNQMTSESPMQMLLATSKTAQDVHRAANDNKVDEDTNCNVWKNESSNRWKKDENWRDRNEKEENNFSTWAKSGGGASSKWKDEGGDNKFENKNMRSSGYESGKFRDGGENKFRSGDENRFRSGDENRFRSGDENRFRSGDENRFRSTDENRFRSGDENRFRSSDENRFRSGDENRFRSGDENRFRSGDDWQDGARFKSRDSGRFDKTGGNKWRDDEEEGGDRRRYDSSKRYDSSDQHDRKYTGKRDEDSSWRGKDDSGWRGKDDWKSDRGASGGDRRKGSGGYKPRDDQDNSWKQKKQYGEREPRSTKSINYEQETLKSNDEPSRTEIQYNPRVKEFIGWELKSTKDVEVYLSHIESPDRFYVRAIEGESELNKVREMIDNDSKLTSRQLPAKGIAVGAPVIARFKEDDLLYRAVISKIVNPRLVEVLYVDYGNSGDVEKSELYLLSDELGTTSTLAICCSLADVKPTSAQGWSAVDFDLMNSCFAGDKLIMSVDSVKSIDGQLIHSVQLKRTDGMSVAQLLADNGLAKKTGSGIMPAAPAQPQITDILPPVAVEEEPWLEKLDLLLGQFLQVNILSIVDSETVIVKLKACNLIVLCSVQKTDISLKIGDAFIIQVNCVLSDRLRVTLYDSEGYIAGDSERALPPISPVCPMPVTSKTNMPVVIPHAEGTQLYLQKTSSVELLSEVLENLYNFYEGSQPSPKDWQKNALCVVKSSDENWYRARILDNKITVRFIDYGNTEVVNEDSIRTLDPQFYFPEMALKAELYMKLSNTDLNIMTIVGEDEFTARLEKLDPDNWIVDLIDNTGKRLISKMKELGNGSDQGHSPFTETNSIISYEIIKGANVPVTVTHVDNPNSFWVQLTKHVNTVAVLQSKLQNVIDDQPELAQVCGVFAAKYTMDKLWYRALECEPDSESVRFIDYGNSDVAIERKKLPHYLCKPATGYAIQFCLCVKPLNGVWSTDALKTFETFIDLHQLTAEVISVSFQNVVDLKVNDKYLSKRLIDQGLAVYDDFTPEPIKNYLKCCETKESDVFVSFIVSLDEFYVQEESRSGDLDVLCSAFESSDLAVLSSYKENDLVAAQDPSDSVWYRAKIIKINPITVLFIDYGNSSEVTEVRKLPDSLSSISLLAIKCSLGVNIDSPQALEKFSEITDEGNTKFLMTILVKGDTNIVKLTLEGVDIVDLLPQIPKKEINIDGKTCFVCHSNNPNDFYIHLLDGQIDNVIDELVEAATFGDVSKLAVGLLVAALFPDDEQWYRAKILSTDPLNVHFYDYGNTSIVTKIKELPPDLKSIPPLAHHCSLASHNHKWSDEETKEFLDHVMDSSTPFKVVLKSSGDPNIVSLLNEANVDLLSSTSLKPAEKSVHNKRVVICYVDMLESFFLQLEEDTGTLDEMSNSLLEGANLKHLDSPVVGSIVAALFPDDSIWYRSKVKQTQPDILVQFIDYGNESVVTELRELPDKLKCIPPLAVQCSLKKPAGINSWNDKTETSFFDLTSDCSNIFVAFIHSDDNDIKTVSLLLNEKNITELFVDIKVETSEVITESKINKVKPNLAQEGVEIAGSILSDVVSLAALKPNFDNKTVMIPHSNSMLDFYVQLESDFEKIPSIVEKLSNAHNFRDAKDVKINDIIAVEYSFDEQWYRGKVVQLKPQTLVVLIDYGNTAIGEKMKILPQELKDIPPLTYRCSLELPPKFQSLITYLEGKFYDYIIDATNLFTVHLKTIGDPNIVVLKLNGIDIIDVIMNSPVEMNVESSDQSIVAEVIEKTIDDAMFIVDQIDKETTDSELKSTALKSEESISLVVENNLSENFEMVTDKNEEEDDATIRNFSSIRGKVVTVSHVNNLSDFFVQLNDDIEKIIPQICDTLVDSEKFEDLLGKNIGQDVVAKYKIDDVWYRGKIIKTEPEVEVIFSDYGNTAIVSDLKKCPDELKKVPPLAFHCSLKKPEVVTQWSDEAEKKFIDFSTSNTEPITIDGDSFDFVTLKLPNDDLLQILNLSPQEKGIINFEDIFITHCDSPHSFYLQKKNSMKALEEIRLKMMDLFDTEPLKDLQQISINDLVASKFSEDGQWYRSKITSIEPLMVYFIDYGNSATVVEIKELSDDLKNIDPLAFHCTLVSPKTTSDWSCEAVNYFVSLTCDGPRSFQMEILKQGDPMTVDLLLDGNSVTSELLDMCPLESGDEYSPRTTTSGDSIQVETIQVLTTEYSPRTTTSGDSIQVETIQVLTTALDTTDYDLHSLSSLDKGDTTSTDESETKLTNGSSDVKSDEDVTQGIASLTLDLSNRTGEEDSGLDTSVPETPEQLNKSVKSNSIEDSSEGNLTDSISVLKDTKEEKKEESES